MKITNFCNGNKCSRCGACCSDFIMISDAEIKAIFQYIIAHPEIEEQNGKPTPDGKIHILCPFYSAEQKKCLIYKVRPKICKEFKCNKFPELLDEIKKTYSPDKYHNASYDDILSLHEVFFNNPIIKYAYLQDKEKIGL